MSCFKITSTQFLSNLYPSTSDINSESISLSEQLLSDNHENFDVFLTERKTHNHLAHHILASLSLGASPEQIKIIFEQHIDKQRVIPQALAKITRENYKHYLNKSEAYTSFLEFFTFEIKEYSMDETVRRWVWCGDILTRTIGGLFHPFIHIGFGLEFNLPGMVAEGLAMACCTESWFQPLTSIQPELNKGALISPTASVAFVDTELDKGSGSQKNRATGVDNTDSILTGNPLIQTILAIQSDPEFDDVIKPSMISERIQSIVTNGEVMSKIKKYLDTWNIEATTQGIHTSYQQLYECILVLYGASAFGPKEKKNSEDKKDFILLDFVFMHTLTSVYFIYFYLKMIDPSEAIFLLREHWASTVVHYMVSGRPFLNMDKLVAYEEDIKGWNQIIMDNSFVCQEAHVVKAVRSLALGEMLFGQMENETINSLWVKVAHMTIVNDGKWNFDGLGFASTWAK